ncbi:glycoside hydrolase family 79 protein [Mycena floridula]|nr:glycoside hydrolase family 79 protein [Mycena floridula]
MIWLPLSLSSLPAVSALTVSVPLSPPTTAPTLSPALISFSIEQDRWTDWSGTTSRNQFFFNTLDNLKQLTGQAPHIRIGANSEDHTDFNSDLEFSQTIFPAPTSTVPYPEALNITVGDAYYHTARFLPRGTHVTWGVNFGQSNLTAAFLEAQAIVRAFNSPVLQGAGVVLDYIEIGNEPDLYKNNGLRPSTYNVTQYVPEWISFAANISELIQGGSTKFLTGSFAGSSHTSSGFSPQGIFAAGILQSKPGPLIGAVSEHRYSGSFCTGNGGLLQDLMTKSTIRGNLSTFIPDIAVTRAKGLDYILGETNSYACHGAPGVSDRAGAALWTLDYALFAPQIGISQVFYHVGVGFKYSLIQPVTLTRDIEDGSTIPPLAPHVQPQYYAAIIAAEAIGPHATQAFELVIDNPRISGYAFYENGVLKRALLINSRAFLKANSTTEPQNTRTSVHVDWDFGEQGLDFTEMVSKRLAIGYADDLNGLTWGGQTYETSDGKVAGKIEEERCNVALGVDIQETEVVLVRFV